MAVVNFAHTVDVKERLETIKSTGYWRVNIRPTKFEKLRIDHRERCWEIVESCSVYLRGWDYPAVHYKERFFEKDYVQSGADFEGKVELWRLYKSGQFIHYFACIEDSRRERIANRIGQDASGGLSILSTLYSITEIFEFATRLAQKGVLQPRLQISIKLVGMENRQLFFWNSGRNLFSRYTCKEDEILFNEELSPTEIMASGRDKALDITIGILQSFNWSSPSRAVLAEDQQRFLQKRL